MNAWMLALALASTGQTGDTGTPVTETPSSVGSTPTAPSDTGVGDTASSSADPVDSAEEAAPAAIVTAAALRGEEGGLGCDSSGHGPVRFLVLLGLLGVLRWRAR